MQLKQMRPATLRRSDGIEDYIQVMKPSVSPDEKKTKPSEGDLSPLCGDVNGDGLGMKLGKSSRGPVGVPPLLEITPVLRNKRRFYVPTGGGFNLTPSSVLGSLGTMCTVLNSAVWPFCSSFRIRSITVYNGLSASSATTAAVLYQSALSAQVRDSEKSVTYPEGATLPGPTKFVPPKGAIASFWQSFGASNFIRIACTSGSVIDVDIEYTLSNSFAASASTAIASGTVGSVYYLALDGPTSNAIKPVNLPTTA